MTLVHGPGPDLVERLGIRLRRTGAGADPGVLLGLALRRNPRRAQLLVSTVLGKHVPTDPRLVRAAGLLLGGLAADALAGRAPRELPVDLLHAAVAGDPAAAATLQETGLQETGLQETGLQGTGLQGTGPLSDALVLGFAETATALGHCVAEALGADYLHSTRRPVAGYATAGGFAEEHSHATDHLLLPADPALLRGGRPLVLVDDELSTGRTALNTITALHRIAPRERYVLASLVDMRATDGLADAVAALGARLDVVSLARGAVELPADLAARATALRAEIDALARRPSGPVGPSAGPHSRVDLDGPGWPAGLAVGGRHGFAGTDHARLSEALPELAARVAAGAGIGMGERVLVLGTEELMALPLRLAQVLADTGHDVAFSTTTRSPAVVADSPGYALTSGIAFPAHDDPADGPGIRYAYNLGGRRWDHTLVVVDPPADTPALHTGLLAALAPHARRTTVVVTP